MAPRRQYKPPRETGIVIFTDGACEPNPGAGGWAFVVYQDGVEIEHACGGSKASTNNAMEMTGMLEALRWVEKKLPKGQPGATIYCDSIYVVKGTTIWSHNWARAGWKKAGGPILNLTLWKEIHALMPRLPVNIHWIKGHAGFAGNERADKLAGKGRRAALVDVDYSA